MSLCVPPCFCFQDSAQGSEASTTATRSCRSHATTLAIVCVSHFTDTVGRWHQQQWHDDISKRNGRWHVEASDKGGRGTRASSPASTVCFVYFLVPVLTLKLCLSRNFGIRKLFTVSSCLATEKNKKIVLPQYLYKFEAWQHCTPTNFPRKLLVVVIFHVCSRLAHSVHVLKLSSFYERLLQPLGDRLSCVVSRTTTSVDVRSIEAVTSKARIQS